MKILRQCLMVKSKEQQPRIKCSQQIKAQRFNIEVLDCVNIIRDDKT